MGAAGEEEPMQEPSGNIERIYVSVRLRPLNEKEIARNDVTDWECINDNTVIYRNNLSVAERSLYPTAYTFDRVFSRDCTTRKVYEEGAKEVALSVVSGINSSVFAYGQTSSGKTYTMSGITEYAMADIYDYVEKHKEREFNLKFSAMEIYNESVRDLLSADSSPLRLLDDPERGTIVERLTEETLKEWSHFKELLSICEAQRQIGETSLNETSSRSHQILRLTIESSAREFLGNDTSSLTATVNFVDLAGSERASQALSAGTRLKEGCHINRSLLTLGTVIRKLSKGRNGHIPYRDSKLTRILQSSLGDNARTAIICTLSPARSHVEQSRNTLLFASCAKEVTTNAQVNIVMSDKALVKHLQRQLSRLEDELQNSGKYPVTPDSSAILREKDIEIEKLKREVTELTIQRDLARAQVEDVLREAGNISNDRPSVVNALENQYPKLRVRNSWDSTKSQTPALANPEYLDISGRSSDVSQYSDGHSRSSSEENFFQLPGYQENFLQSSSPREQEVTVSNSVGTDMHQDKNEEKIDKSLEDPYKDVRCVQMEGSTILNAESTKLESSSGKHGDSDISSVKVNPAISGLTEAESGDRQNEELRTPTSKELKEWKNILPDFVIPSVKEPYPWLPEKDTSSHSSLKFRRSRSCKAKLMTSLSLYPLENDDKDENTPPIGFEKDYIGRPMDLQRKFNALKYAGDNENLSTNASQTSANSAFDELKAQNVEPSYSAGSTRVSTLNLQMASDSAGSTSVGPLNLEVASVSGSTYVSTLNLSMEEMTDPQNEKQLADDVDKKAKLVAPGRSVKDVGLDPIQEDPVHLWNWPSEFKRLQIEIIELWHACNVSLVHRTYFFMLFKGDPKDSIYMEVEHRRLSFLRDTFARGNQTVEDGRTVTRASSFRALCQERHMLSHQMKKKFSEEERQNLFLKWGVGLQTKHRRWKLVSLLWTDTKDMNHIAESASIVEKLVKFIKPEQAFKEMFGLNFAPRPSRKKFNLKNSVMSLL